MVLLDRRIVLKTVQLWKIRERTVKLNPEPYCSNHNLLEERSC